MTLLMGEAGTEQWNRVEEKASLRIESHEHQIQEAIIQKIKSCQLRIEQLELEVHHLQERASRGNKLRATLEALRLRWKQSKLEQLKRVTPSIRF